MTLVFLLGCLFWEDVESFDWITIHLSGHSGPYRHWVLKLDNNQAYTFNADGSLKLIRPEDSKSFEVLDARQRPRFLGVWKQYQALETINIEVNPEVLSLHQVVSASRVAQNVWEVPSEMTVISPKNLSERGISQTSDWLKEQAEISLQKTNLGGGAPIIRGMSGNRVLLMVDGFRLNNATFRLGLNQYLNTVPASQLDQIEVLSGPSGVQYGSDGLGGTIHLRGTDPAAEEGSGGGYQGMLSSADGTHTHQLDGRTQWGRLYVGGHFKFNHYEDLEAADPVGDQNPTGYEGWDSSLNLTYKIDEMRRLRLINYYSSATHVPRTDRILSGRDLLWEYHPQKQSIHGLKYEDSRQRPIWDHFDIGLGLLRQDEGTRRISAGNPGRLALERTQVDTWQANATFTKTMPGVQWVYGFDSQYDQVDSSGSAQDLNLGILSFSPGKFPEDAAYRGYGLFLISEIKLSPAQRLKAGLRQSWSSLEGTLAAPIGAVRENYQQLTPSLNWSWSADHWFLSLGANQGFRAPNLEDALALGPSNRGFDAPNPNLKPEELWSYELLLRWHNDRSQMHASLYTSRYDRLVERVPGLYQGSDTIDGEPVFILDNVGKAKVDGVSLFYQYRIDHAHRLESDASWTRGEQTDRNEPMTRIPPLRGNLSWVFENDKWKCTALFTWADRQNRLSPGDIADSRIPLDGTPGYGVVHLRGHYRINERFSANLGLENLGDKLYKSHGSGIFEPGRRAVLQFKAHWK